MGWGAEGQPHTSGGIEGRTAAGPLLTRAAPRLGCDHLGSTPSPALEECGGASGLLKAGHVGFKGLEAVAGAAGPPTNL